MVLRGFHGFQGQKVCQPVATCGLVKSGAATPLTNLCSDAGVGRRLGCLDISFLSGFMWFCLDLGGFTWISWIPGAESLSACGNLWSG